MTIDDNIRDEKLQYDIQKCQHYVKEAAKMSALPSGKIDKYEYSTGEEILSFNQRHIIEQDKLADSPFAKAFEKQTKTIEDQGQIQIEAIKDNKKQLDNKQPGNNELLLSKKFIRNI